MNKIIYFAAIMAASVCVLGCKQQGHNNFQSSSAVDTVVISRMQFHPDTLHISEGDTVVWVNRDFVEHYVAAFPDEEWGSGPILPDSIWSKVIRKDWEYYCNIHPTMKAKIIIETE